MARSSVNDARSSTKSFVLSRFEPEGRDFESLRARHLHNDDCYLYQTMIIVDRLTNSSISEVRTHKNQPEKNCFLAVSEAVCEQQF
jgi:hypothetical protein